MLTVMNHSNFAMNWLYKSFISPSQTKTRKMTQTYPHLVFVYFTAARAPVQLRLSQNTPYDELITTLHSLLQYPDNRKVVKLEYHSPSLDAEGKVKFTLFQLKNDDDLEVM